MDLTWLQIAAIPIPLVFAIVFHEIAHGWTARLLGDPTALEARRLSLNPFRHVDPVGTLLLPAFLALVKAPVFGWARPVPVNKWRLDNPRRDMMIVAAAGPGSNLVLATLAAVLYGLMLRFVPDGAGVVAHFVALSLVVFIQFNVFLALFNLLPVPPFDGSHIVEGLLPRDLARRYAGMRRYALPLLFLLLLVIPQVFPQWNVVERFVFPPVSWVLDRFDALSSWVGGV